MTVIQCGLSTIGHVVVVRGKVSQCTLRWTRHNVAKMFLRMLCAQSRTRSQTSPEQHLICLVPRQGGGLQLLLRNNANFSGYLGLLICAAVHAREIMDLSGSACAIAHALLSMTTRI